eukprot:Tbor_TRINITY_DN5001_c0_g1::TRINITY_DN5001_c0_g1_i1::g.14413::m.14413
MKANVMNTISLETASGTPIPVLSSSVHLTSIYPTDGHITIMLHVPLQCPRVLRIRQIPCGDGLLVEEDGDVVTNVNISEEVSPKGLQRNVVVVLSRLGVRVIILKWSVPFAPIPLLGSLQHTNNVQLGCLLPVVNSDARTVVHVVIDWGNVPLVAQGMLLGSKTNIAESASMDSNRGLCELLFTANKSVTIIVRASLEVKRNTQKLAFYEQCLNMLGVYGITILVTATVTAFAAFNALFFFYM